MKHPFTGLTHRFSNFFVIISIRIYPHFYGYTFRIAFKYNGRRSAYQIEENFIIAENFLPLSKQLRCRKGHAKSCAHENEGVPDELCLRKRAVLSMRQAASRWQALNSLMKTFCDLRWYLFFS